MEIKRENLTLPLQALVPYEKNARTHSPEQIAQITASIKQFGFTAPAIVSRGTSGILRIIAGHGRAEAAKSLGMAEIPCVVLDGLTDSQVRALVLADNRLALNAGWDDKMLSAELLQLEEHPDLLKITGFTGREFDVLLCRTKEKTEEDETPALPATPRSVLGDIYQLGQHRVMCGDSTQAHAVDALLAGATPLLMVTDPPYGVEYDAAAARDGSSATGKVLNDDRADWREAWALFPGRIAYVWHADRHCGEVFDSLQACDFKVRAQIIWAKSSLVFSRGDYHSQHEPCFYAVKGTGNWTGDRKQSTLWEIDKPQRSETGHSTQKPVECMRRPMLNNSSEGDIIYDPFLGSGTTLIAAEATKRVCYGMELNPAYVDIIVKRWEEFTGLKAVLQPRVEAA